MRVKIFDRARPDPELESSLKTQSLEQAINSFLETGVIVKNITQSSISSGVFISIWYEEVPQSQEMKHPGDCVLADSFKQIPTSTVNFPSLAEKILKEKGVQTMGQLLEKLFYCKDKTELRKFLGSSSYQFQRQIQTRLADFGIIWDRIH